MEPKTGFNIIIQLYIYMKRRKIGVTYYIFISFLGQDKAIYEKKEKGIIIVEKKSRNKTIYERDTIDIRYRGSLYEL